MTVLQSDGVYSPKEAAAILQVHPETLLRWVREGKVQASRLSGSKRPTIRLTGASLQEMLSRMATPIPEPAPEPARRTGRPRKQQAAPSWRERLNQACGLK